MLWNSEKRVRRAQWLALRPEQEFIKVWRAPEFIPGNPFRQAMESFQQPMWSGGIDSLESIPGLLKLLQIRALLYVRPGFDSYPALHPRLNVQSYYPEQKIYPAQKDKTDKELQEE